MRKCKKQRHPFDHLTRISMVDYQNVKEGRQKDRVLIAGRSAAATKCAVTNAASAKWRNWEWCIDRLVAY